MIKLRLIAALLLATLLCGSALAQNVQYSDYQKFDFRVGDFAVVGMTGNRLYTYRSGSDGFFLDAYNDSMGRVATVMLDFFPQKIYQTRFISYPDRIIVLYQAVEGNKIVQYAALLDQDARLVKGPLQIDVVKTGIFGPTRTYFSSAVSDDKKTIVVFRPSEKGSQFTMDARWINDSLGLSGRSHATFKAENDLEYGEAMAGNDGNLYIPVGTPVGTSNYKDQVWLLTLTKAAPKFTAKELPLNSLYAGSTYMKVDNANKRIYVGGFYAGKKNGSYEGLIYAYYDIAANDFPVRKAIAFDKPLLSETRDRNKKRAFDNFKVKELVVKNDGGFVLVSEDFYVVTRSSYAPGFGYYSWYYSPYMANTIREYHYDNIMALSYNGEGTRQWDAFIPKEQYSQEDGGLFSSYALMNTGGSLAFMYNDYNTNQSRIQLATLDPNGKVESHGFTPEGNNSPDWLPRSAKQVAGRVIIIPCLRKKEICFAKVVF